MKDYKTYKLESVMFLLAYDAAHSYCLPSQTPLLSFTARKQCKWRAFEARADLEHIIVLREHTELWLSWKHDSPHHLYSIIKHYICIQIRPPALQPLIRYLQSVRGKPAGNPGEGTLSAGCSKRFSASTEHLSFFFGVTGTWRAHTHPWPQLACWCRWIWVCLYGGE